MVDLLPDILHRDHVAVQTAPGSLGRVSDQDHGNLGVQVLKEVTLAIDDLGVTLLEDVGDNHPRINLNMGHLLTVRTLGPLYVPITCGTSVKQAEEDVQSTILKLACLM